MSEWANIAIRFGLYADLMLLFGAAFFALYALRGGDRLSGQVLPLRLLLPALALGGILLSAAGMAVTLTTMTGLRLSEVDAETVGILINETPLGVAWKVRVLALLVAAAAAYFIASPTLSLWIVGLASAAALGSLAWGGHAAAGEGLLGIIDLASDTIHLLAAGIWVGALAVLILMLFHPFNSSTEEGIRLAHRSLEGFSVLGTIVVVVLTLTGLLQSWRRVGVDHLFSLPSSPYGQLLLVKLALFLLMLGLASVNRFRLTPALGRQVASDGSVGLGRLRASLAVETGAAVFILALVAWFGTLEPPMPTG